LETDIFYFIIVQPTPEPEINALDFTSVFSLVGINFEIGIQRILPVLGCLEWIFNGNLVFTLLEIDALEVI